MVSVLWTWEIRVKRVLYRAWAWSFIGGVNYPAYPSPDMEEALGIVNSGVCSLPGCGPCAAARPQWLTSPLHETDLETWIAREAAARERLDEAVRAWLSAGHWPSTLSAEDGFRLLLRLRAARLWLLAASQMPVPWMPARVMVEWLLVDSWAYAFLDDFLEVLRYRMAMYHCGVDDAGG